MTPSKWIDPEARANGPPPDRLLPFARWALGGCGLALSIAGIVSVLGGIVEVTAALILGRVIDAALAVEPSRVFAEQTGVLLTGLVFFLVIRPLFFGGNALMQNVTVAPNVLNLTLQRLHRHTLGQSVTFFDEDFAGRISQKEMQTARALTDIVVEMNQTVLLALASVTGAVLLLTTVDARIALGLVAWLAVYLWTIRVFMPRIRKRSMARAAARANVTGQIVDTITNIKTVKLFAHADHEDRAALSAMSALRGRALDYGRISVAFRFWLITIAGFLPVMLVGGALWYWTKGLVTAGDIAATGAVSIRLAQMTGWVSFTLMGIYANIGEVEDGIRTLSLPHALADRPDAVELDGPPVVRFDGVSFAYGRRTGGVCDLGLTAHQGEKLGIVGASGAGKSTLVALLMRLYDAESGIISIGGQEVRGVTQKSLRRRIGMVTQETAMFNRSARDNILYGRPEAGEAEMIGAAKRARAHEFILDLQDYHGRTGYEAFLGERGVKLSGGQRQRIALARAILKDAPILVLDEATSALDSEVEAEIQEALVEVMRGKTVLAIAHRLSTIARMDRIIVLDQGRVAEQGTHADLLAREGLYARYWRRQSGGFMGLPEAAE